MDAAQQRMCNHLQMAKVKYKVQAYRDFTSSVSGEFLYCVNGNSIIILQIFITLKKVYIVYIVSMEISLLFSSREFLYCVSGNSVIILHLVS